MQSLVCQKLSLNLLQMQAFLYSFRRVSGATFITFIRDVVKPAINIYSIPYDPKQEWRHIIYLVTNHFYGYAMSKFFQTGGFKWIGPSKFDSNKYSSNSSKVAFQKLILNILIKLHELNNDYPLASDKTEIKKEMLSNYQLKTFIIFLLPMLKNKCLNLLIKKNMCFIMNTCNFI